MAIGKPQKTAQARDLMLSLARLVVIEEPNRESLWALEVIDVQRQFLVSSPGS